MQKKDIPNAICWFRIALIPIVLIFLIPTPLTAGVARWATVLISGLLYAIAIFSDMVDGKIARKYNYISDLGKFLDPIADKMLVLSVCVAFVGLNAFGWLLSFSVIAILLRELMVTGLRLSAASGGAVIAANWWGKIKTILQGITIGVTYFLLLLGQIFPVVTPFYWIAEVLFLLTAIFTWISAVPYIKACAPYLKG